MITLLHIQDIFKKITIAMLMGKGSEIKNHK